MGRGRGGGGLWLVVREVLVRLWLVVGEVGGISEVVVGRWRGRRYKGGCGW